MQKNTDLPPTHLVGVAALPLPLAGLIGVGQERVRVDPLQFEVARHVLLQLLQMCLGGTPEPRLADAATGGVGDRRWVVAWGSWCGGSCWVVWHGGSMYPEKNTTKKR